ncbi:SRPBCC family protein [Tritonibacter sp. SIMBA_163]|uniref:SRPBCC family protein n=1 Tax=Tritonibacter sp. SIMBA_163 TaxID=3080868 RepID=UPI0039816575
MHFETKEDTDCPIQDLFVAISDFESFERSAIRRGVDVQRHGDTAAPRDGLYWDVTFNFRGSERRVRIDVADYDVPNTISFAAVGNGMSGDLKVDLMALSAQRTRMTVRVDLKPKTLAARLLLQSLKLARNKLNRKFRTRVAEFARQTEERRARSA